MAEQQRLIDDINAALEAIGDDDDSAEVAARAGRRMLASLEDEPWLGARIRRRFSGVGAEPPVPPRLETTRAAELPD